MLKDLKLAEEAARSVGADTALRVHAAEIYDARAKAGHGGMDFSAVIQSIRARSTQT